MKTLKTSGAMLAVAALTLLADQVTKWLVSTRLQLYEMWAPLPQLETYFTLTYTTNTGAAFGLFKEWGTVFAGIAILVIVAIIYYQRHLPDGQWWLRLALGLQLGGAAGNLVDRLRLGHVVDFLDFKLWPVFNLADSAIVLGVGLLMLLMVREAASAPQTQPVSSNRPPPAEG